MKRAFTDLNNDEFLKLHKAMVRPIIEYANTIWDPHFLLDKRRLERVQRRVTKMIPSLSDKLYHHCLISLNLPSLNYGSIRGDLIFLYKLINRYFNSDFLLFYSMPWHSHQRKFIETLQTLYSPPSYVDQNIFL